MQEPVAVLTKICKTCAEAKPFTDFRPEKRVHSGLTANCRACIRQYDWRYRDENRERQRPINAAGAARRRKTELGQRAQSRNRRKYYLKVSYGITDEVMVFLIAQQDNKCGICKRAFMADGGYHKKGVVSSCVDHDHETGKVRGILCNRCNRAMGMFDDKIEYLRAAAEYLQRSM